MGAIGKTREGDCLRLFKNVGSGKGHTGPPAQQHDIQCHLVKCVTLSHM